MQVCVQHLLSTLWMSLLVILTVQYLSALSIGWDHITVYSLTLTFLEIEFAVVRRVQITYIWGPMSIYMPRDKSNTSAYFMFCNLVNKSEQGPNLRCRVDYQSKKVTWYLWSIESSFTYTLGVCWSFNV